MASKRILFLQDILLLVVIIAILISIIILLRQTLEAFVSASPQTAQAAQAAQTGNIPKTIWSYWDDPATVPKTVKLCMESWKKHNPNYTIHLLTKNTYSEFVDIPKTVAEHPNMNDMKQHFADLVRCYVLAKHGGVWVDSSILMNRPLDSWLFEKSTTAELYAFTITFDKTAVLPVIENWFFAAPENSQFMRQWRDEFTKLTEYPSARDYVASRHTMGVSTKGWVDPNYLAMHVSAAKLIQVDKYPIDRLSLWRSEEGPYKYLFSSNWESSKALVAACSDKSLRNPFIKMRGMERTIFEKGYDTEFASSKCQWV